jgi:hypothetical protein
MIVVQTFGYATIAIRIFRYDMYSFLKYWVYSGKGHSIQAEAKAL